MAAAVHGQRLPVKAAIEGPAACFRLLEIDGDLGIGHDQFVGLLMSATDNRLTLEHIQEAWVRHAGVDQASHECAADNGQELRRSIVSRMQLPPFLQAFAELARNKYCEGQSERDVRGSTNRLLLRDVFDNITNPTTVDARYGMCAHLLREDVCNFLLSRRPFTTRLFSMYGEAPTSPRFSGRGTAGDGLARVPHRAQDDEEQTRSTISESAVMFWPGVLAVASDLQLIPRLIGLDALKAAVEQVSVAPHRMKVDNEIDALLDGSPLDQGAEPKRAATTGISYPQFVEVLSLLSASAAGRLRPLYPDVAGSEPSTAVHGSHNTGDLTGCSADGTTDLGEPFAVERESIGAGRGVDWRDTDETSKNSGKHTFGKARHVRAALRLKNARSAFEDRGKLVAPDVDEQAQEALPTYDLGALKALFHHAVAAFEESRPGPAHDRGSSLKTTSRQDVGSLGRDQREQGMPPSTALRDCAFERRSRSSTSVDMNDESSSRYEGQGGTPSNPMREGTAAESKSQLHGLFSPLESVPIVEKISRRVADLELEILPCEINECEIFMAANVRSSGASLCRDKRADVEHKSVPGSIAPGAGGAFARLVVIKELQPVPEHVPDDARHLFELTLDHHQAGRYPLALETLEKGIAMWKNLSGMDQVHNEPTAGEGGLDASDEALAFSMKASIYQCAGNDEDALSMLFRADQAVASINQDDAFLRQACLASVLSEIGVTLYYSSRADLSLRCFRMALFIRHRLLQCNERHILENEQQEPVSDMDYAVKRAAKYGTTDFDAVATEAGETVAALTLNNVAVCLAATGEIGRAVEALVTSSAITTSTLGVDHPRSGVVSRNLALVKATKGGARRGTPAGTSVGERRTSFWEKKLWHSLDTRQWALQRRTDGREDLLLHNGVSQRTSHVIPGGFLFAGKLPNAADGIKKVGSRGSRPKKGLKKKGKSGRPRR